MNERSNDFLEYTARAAEVKRSPIDLGPLSPNEIIALNRYLVTSRDKIRDSVNTRTLAELRTQVDHALEQLPSRDLNRARVTYTAFVESPLAVDRLEACYILRYLTRVDRECGILLWDRLIRDQDAEVRSEAKDLLGDYEAAIESKNYNLADEALEELGITGPQAAALLDAYAAAEEGKGLFDAGEVALQAVVTPSRDQLQ